MKREEIHGLIDTYGISCLHFGMDLGSPLPNPSRQICDDFESEMSAKDKQIEELKEELQNALSQYEESVNG